jgi:AcrR family transcriptional regulator
MLTAVSRLQTVVFCRQKAAGPNQALAPSGGRAPIEPSAGTADMVRGRRRGRRRKPRNETEAKRSEGARRRAILHAAEDVFAHRGFAGASIRLIASTAGVNSALVGYYFGTKAELYETVFAARYRDITRERAQLLDAVAIAAGERASLDAILNALLRPFVERLHTEESRSFVQLLANEAIDPLNSDRDIVEKYLNPTARRFMAAIRKALPDLSRADLAWAYQFCVFVMITGATGSARVATLSTGASARERANGLVERMIAFCSAGLRAVARARARRK